MEFLNLMSLLILGIEINAVYKQVSLIGVQCVWFSAVRGCHNWQKTLKTLNGITRINYNKLT